MKFATADLCDAYPDKIEVATPGLHHYGGRHHLHGTIATVRCHEDNTRVRELLASAGAGRVLVVDGGGSTRCALLGDRMAAMAINNEWHGVIIHGCVRDTVALSQLPLGICALGSNPHRSAKKRFWRNRRIGTFCWHQLYSGCLCLCRRRRYPGLCRTPALSPVLARSSTPAVQARVRTSADAAVARPPAAGARTLQDHQDCGAAQGSATAAVHGLPGGRCEN